MTSIRDIALERKQIFSRYGLDRNVIRCVLVGADFDDSPRVDGRNGFVWAKEFNSNSGAFQAFNPYVQSRVGLQVLVAAEPKPPWRRMVIDVDWSAFLDTADSFDELSFQPQHHTTHEFPDGHPAADVVFIYPRALTPLRLSPMIGLIASVNAGVYLYQNVVVQFYGENIDLTSYVPTVDGNSVWVTIYIDPETNSLGVLSGTELSYVIGATYAALPNNVIPIAFVLLTEGMTSITESLITDARPSAAIGIEDVDTFLYLLDTPDSYNGYGQYILAVKADESGVEFVPASASGIDEFTELIDTPNSYVGQGGKDVVVNGAETGLEFLDRINTFLELTDTPDNYAGYGDYLLSVKAAEDGVEFIPPSASGIDEFTELIDTPDSYIGYGTYLLSVKAAENGVEFTDPDVGVDDHKVMVSANDNTPDYLENKVFVGSVNMGITVQYEGANERLYIQTGEYPPIFDTDGSIVYDVDGKVTFEEHPVYWYAPNSIPDVALQHDLFGWVQANETWTYFNAATFTIPGDKTGKYQKGDKIKLTQTTVKYFYITSVTYSVPNTVITITGGSDYALANAAITDPFYSKISNPQGFPQWFNWTPTFVNFTLGNGTVNFARFKIADYSCFIELKVTLGSTSSVTGVLGFQTPVTLAANAYAALGFAIFSDTGTAFYLGRAVFANTTQINFNVDNASGTYLTPTNVTATVPHTWANTDVFGCNAIAEI